LKASSSEIENYKYWHFIFAVLEMASIIELQEYKQKKRILKKGNIPCSMEATLP
jgi:hypothetical protein